MTFKRGWKLIEDDANCAGLSLAVAFSIYFEDKQELYVSCVQQINL